MEPTADACKDSSGSTTGAKNALREQSSMVSSAAEVLRPAYAETPTLSLTGTNVCVFLVTGNCRVGA